MQGRIVDNGSNKAASARAATSLWTLMVLSSTATLIHTFTILLDRFYFSKIYYQKIILKNTVQRNDRNQSPASRFRPNP